MHKSATKYNETIGKWCKNKHGASKIIDTLETYQPPIFFLLPGPISPPHASSPITTTQFADFLHGCSKGRRREAGA
jgi:hypothetical protein